MKFTIIKFGNLRNELRKKDTPRYVKKMVITIETSFRIVTRELISSCEIYSETIGRIPVIILNAINFKNSDLSKVKINLNVLGICFMINSSSFSFSCSFTSMLNYHSSFDIVAHIKNVCIG